jgi:DNA-binding sugar fermentation-stimulating protein
LTINEEIIEGIFLEESKNRFLCYVLIGEQICECYVPSASKLKNYLNMRKKRVLLLMNKNNNLRTKYSVFAVKYYNKYIILNMSVPNRILEKYLKETNSLSKIEREKYFNGYKSDFLVTGEKTIIVEAKGIIAIRKEINFPIVHCQRAIDQLYAIEKLLIDGYMVEYYLISLSPIVRSINISQELKFKKYRELLLSCIKLGMIIRGFNINFKNNKIELGNKIKLLIREEKISIDK